MKQRFRQLQYAIITILRRFGLMQQHRTESPLGLMASKCLILWHPHQDKPEEPVISTTQMDRLDAYLCADCAEPLPPPYDAPCQHCGSTFHLHETYTLQLATPQHLCAMKHAGLI